MSTHVTQVLTLSLRLSVRSCVTWVDNFGHFETSSELCFDDFLCHLYIMGDLIWNISTKFCIFSKQKWIPYFCIKQQLLNFLRKTSPPLLLACGARAEALLNFFWKWVGHSLFFYKKCPQEGLMFLSRLVWRTQASKPTDSALWGLSAAFRKWSG
jgi:hypothetical protein